MKDLDELGKEQICREMELEIFNGYETVFKCGDHANKLYIILAGKVYVEENKEESIEE